MGLYTTCIKLLFEKDKYPPPPMRHNIKEKSQVMVTIKEGRIGESLRNGRCLNDNIVSVNVTL